MKSKILSRVIALIVDNVLIYGLIVGILINLGKDNRSALSMGSLFFTIYIILSPVIFKGYHFGKYMMNIKIVKDNYNDPSFLNILVRELCKMMYVIPILGVILAIVSNYMINAREDGKAIHDIISKTKVIRV